MDIIKQIEMDKIYKTLPLERIPWDIETPPKILVELIESGRIKPCKVIDLGCGSGNYAIYLATKGFDVTGVDISTAAIRIARKKAKEKKVKCNFFVLDVVEDLDKISKTFDFAYEWGLLHHIFPDKRKRYVKNVYKILNLGGKYLCMCFNEKDNYFSGSGKYRKTPLGTTVYLSSEDELKMLFSPYFNIIDLKVVELHGKFGLHIANYVFMEKKNISL